MIYCLTRLGLTLLLSEPRVVEIFTVTVKAVQKRCQIMVGIVSLIHSIPLSYTSPRSARGVIVTSNNTSFRLYPTRTTGPTSPLGEISVVTRSPDPCAIEIIQTMGNDRVLGNSPHCLVFYSQSWGLDHGASSLILSLLRTSSPGNAHTCVIVVN